jgi:hypothetical protein
LIYPLLFFGLPLLGIAAYVALCRRMRSSVRYPPYAPMFFIFAAYGAVLLFIVSVICNEWSGLLLFSVWCLVFIAAPFLVAQSFLLLWGQRSFYDRAVIWLGFCFPLWLALPIFLILFWRWGGRL